MSDDEGCTCLLLILAVVFFIGFLFGVNSETPDSIIYKDKLCLVQDSKVFCEVK